MLFCDVALDKRDYRVNILLTSPQKHTLGYSLRYENMPIEIYWKFYQQKQKIFR